MYIDKYYDSGSFAFRMDIRKAKETRKNVANTGVVCYNFDSGCPQAFSFACFYTEKEEVTLKQL